MTWLGKTVDLANAYKQLMGNPDSRRFAVILVWDPVSKSPKYFVSNSMNFGALSAVYAFNRAASSILWLGAHALGYVWTQYYGNFPVLSVRTM